MEVRDLRIAGQLKPVHMRDGKSSIAVLETLDADLRQMGEYGF